MIERLSERMGQLLGPRSVSEIVITLYEDGRINYQIEGMKGPVDPAHAYQMLSAVAAQIAPTIIAPQETPTV